MFLYIFIGPLDFLLLCVYMMYLGGHTRKSLVSFVVSLTQLKNCLHQMAGGHVCETFS